MEAKPSKYLGIQFKSRLEARWGVFFSNYHRVLCWTYEPNPVDTSRGRYTPDFRIKLLEGPEFYLEVKPAPVSEETYSWLMSDVSDVLNHPLVLCIGSFYTRDIRVLYRVSPTQIRVESFHDFFRQSDHGFKIADQYRFDLERPEQGQKKKFKKRLKRYRRRGR